MESATHSARMAGAVHPTGAEHVVRPDELFFSTTDRRGVIRTGNSVFERISRYPMEMLIGAPHNIVRHPAMPSGAFRLMWDRLLAGRPMAAYVANLARDGGTYWVFATVSPMAEGFLSVRMAPCTSLFDAARTLYEDVHQYERSLRERDGLSRAQAAEAGAEQIGRLLRRLGFPSYDHFMLEALPAEVAARGSLVTTSFARNGVPGPVGDILRAAQELDRQLMVLVDRLDRYGELAAELLPAADTVLQHGRRLQVAVEAARDASRDVADVAPVLGNVANVMAQPMAKAVDALRLVSPDLFRLSDQVAQQRFRVALTRLHTEMIAAFAAEAADGLAPLSALKEVPAVCDALHDDVNELAGSTDEVNARLHEVSAHVARAEALLDDFQRFLGQWRILVLRRRQAAALADLLGPIDEQLDAGHDQIDHLRQLSRSMQGGVVPLDPSALDHNLFRIRSAAAYA